MAETTPYNKQVSKTDTMKLGNRVPIVPVETEVGV